MPAPAFAPPHPVAKFRVLKQAWREYLLSGNAYALEVNQPPNQLVTDDTAVSGTVYRDQSAPPLVGLQVVLRLYLNGATVIAAGANIDPVTGGFSHVFTAPFAGPGAGSVRVTLDPIAQRVYSGDFTVT